MELTKKTVSSNTGSAESLDIASQWLSDCSEGQHPHCTERSLNTPLPTRLLRLDSSEHTILYLRQTEQLPNDTRYMTLSHCWGQYQPIALTESNLEMFNSGISVDQLPKTFRDAVCVTKRMSIQYLWIDSLCIIQDSDEDWKRESAKMMNVYAGAYCNIAASSAEDARTGLFFNRSVEIPRGIFLEVPSPPLYRSLAGNAYKKFRAVAEKWLLSADGQLRLEMKRSRISCLKFFTVPFFNPGQYSCEENPDDYPGSVLRKRAWVLQEALLAKRTLHFTSRQLSFGCQEHIVAEIFAARPPENGLERYIHKAGSMLSKDATPAKNPQSLQNHIFRPRMPCVAGMIY